MIVRDFKKEDAEQAKLIFAMYWTDPKFLKEISDQLDEAHFFVAEEHNEIIGVAGLRIAPDYLKKHAKTERPAEFYILASKYKGKGIGEALRVKRMEEAKKTGFTEVLLYSPNSHKESWGFHDRLGFERVGETIAPDGEPGQIWRKAL